MLPYANLKYFKDISHRSYAQALSPKTHWFYLYFPIYPLIDIFQLYATTINQNKN